MNSRIPTPPGRALAALALGLAGFSLGAFAAPVIHSVEVQPTPLVVGEPFEITVDAADATAGIATVDFRPWSPNLARVVLSPAGNAWSGTGVVPLPGSLPADAIATARVTLLDGSRRRVDSTVSLPVVGPGPAITARFHPDSGVLEVRGTDQPDTIMVGVGIDGRMSVNDGQVPIMGGAPLPASTTLVRIFGFGGDDTITFGSTAGFLIPGDLRGGAGDDTLNGGPGPDLLMGGPGRDTLNGRSGNDRILGGPGDDRIVWNPGDSSDRIDGEAGVDFLDFRGSAIAETIDLSADGGRLRFTRNIASIVMDVGSVEKIGYAALGGADLVTVHDLTGTGVVDFNLDLSSPLTPGSGDGQADQLLVLGTPSADLLTVTGTPTSIAIAGLPTTIHVAGIDASLDRLTVDTGDGEDVLVFRGTEDSDSFDLSADGTAARLSGQPGLPIVYTLGTEQVRLEPLASADLVAVGTLTTTAVTAVTVDLAETSGGSTGDGQPDRVLVTGTAGNDTVAITAVGSDVQVTGLSAAVIVRGAEATLDRLGVSTLAGADTLDASALPAGHVPLDLNGGADSDILLGSAGDDVLMGGQGSDLVSGGPGNDTFLWNPGDGSDVLEGQEGTDSLVVNGANIGERIALAAVGPRLRFTRDIASITLDGAGIESVAYRALGGSDVITVGNLAGTGVTDVQLDLAFPAGSGTGDGQSDAVIVEGTPGNDAIQIVGDGTTVVVTGLSARVTLSGSEETRDVLLVDGAEGDDTIVATGLPAGLIQFQADGGEGDDSLFGSDGPDVLSGGPGDDLLVGGPGVDVLDGGSGSNVVVP